MIIEDLKIHEWNESVSVTAYVPKCVPNTMLEAARSLQGQVRSTLRPAVLICPGGGYMGHNEEEMEPVALKFLGAGYCAFILNHSVGAGYAMMSSLLVEVAEAIRMIRDHAVEWHIDPDRIHLCGFSTGAHLLATYGSKWREMNGHKPNAIILGYPILEWTAFKEHLQSDCQSMIPTFDMMTTILTGQREPGREVYGELNCSTHVNGNSVKTFLWSTREDKLVRTQDIEPFVEAIESNGVPYEFHLFEHGGHGVSMAEGIPGTEEWFSLAMKWLMK